MAATSMPPGRTNGSVSSARARMSATARAVTTSNVCMGEKNLNNLKHGMEKHIHVNEEKTSCIETASNVCMGAEILKVAWKRNSNYVNDKL